MDTQQTTPAPVYNAPPGIFGTKIPASVSFAIVILLFLLPFSELRCGGNTIATKTGLDMAFNKEWKMASAGWFDKNEMTSKTQTQKEDKGNVQIYALAALGLCVLGFLISLAGSGKSAFSFGAIAGVLGAGALIGLMIEINRLTKLIDTNQAMNKGSRAGDTLGLDNFTNTVKDTASISVTFTPWFYVAIIALLAAAFFSYRRNTAIRP